MFWQVWRAVLRLRKSMVSRCKQSLWVFEFGPNLIFLVLSQFEYLSFVKIWVFEFCHKCVLSSVIVCFHNLIFWVLSQFEFLSFVKIRFFDFCHNLIFWIFHNLRFGILSQFEFLSFFHHWNFFLFLFLFFRIWGV